MPRAPVNFFSVSVADGGKSEASPLQLFVPALQLHELRFAIGSPVCRTEEDEHQTVATHQRLQRLRAAELVASAECRHRRAHARPEDRNVRPLCRERGSEEPDTPTSRTSGFI